ncbi:MAG: hypothetical protein KFKLKKLM_00750 [Flavobacteriales bacterium]|nr:hypothetical protein [Flavobacteriales bacterium]
MDKIKEIISSDNFKEYQEEQMNLLEKWQYVESASISPENRFELDKEAYFENYHNSAYKSYNYDKDVDEEILIKRLIKNLKPAKHNVWIKYRKYLKKLIKTQKEAKTDAPQKKEYNTSQFNENTYKLFCHIVDEYKKGGNIKFINIWYFLKKDIDKTKNKNILFNFSQKTYKEFVKKYGIEIKKFKKADFKYEEDELGILQNITNTYFTKLK